MLNPVVLSIIVLLLLSLLRINVVLSLIISAIIGGLLGGLPFLTPDLDNAPPGIISIFEGGLGDNAPIALSYAMLGTFAVALSQTGITNHLTHSILRRVQSKQSIIHQNTNHWIKYSILLGIGLMAIASQNIIPVHIAFIPVLIPPLLNAFNTLHLDRRLVACVLTFGLITPYIILPVGFGGIFLNELLLPNLTKNGLTEVTAEMIPKAMLLPALGMLSGLFIAIFISYRKPRTYQLDKSSVSERLEEPVTLNTTKLGLAIVAIIVVIVAQVMTKSMIFGALCGFITLTVTKVIDWKKTHDIFQQGLKLMAMIGFIMMAATGFAAVMKATGGVDTLVHGISSGFADNKMLASLLMLLVGLLVTMGIGSSFSTIPILATIYVPLCINFGFSPMATIALVGTAAALGDAGSPVSDSTIGPTSGLNADGQHDHIWDSVVPTFLHYNLPLIIFGWIASVTL